MEAHASALGGIANSHQRCSDSAIPQPKLSFVSLIAATPPHTLSQLLFQLRCRGKKEEAAPREAQRQHDFSFASWGEEEAAPREAQHSMISASPHGGKKEAAARFLVGGNDGSSRISFGWNRKLASKMLKQCDSAAKAAICFAYRCNASSHALAAAISASLRGGKRGSDSSRAQRQHDFSFAAVGKKEAPPHTLSQLLFQLRCRGEKRKRLLTGSAQA